MKQFQNLTFHRYFFGLGLITLLFVVILEAMADMFSWYYIFPALDIPMHILGGMLVGFFALAYMARHMNDMQKLLWVIGWTILIGILVEVFEWGMTRLFHQEIGFLLQKSALDTYTDILHDFIGGVIAYGAAYFTKRL